MELKSAAFTVFDFETTGLYPSAGDRICEIGALKITGRHKESFHSMIDPGIPISYGAFMVNGITPAMLAGQPKIDEILPRFMKFIEGTVLVAYNAGFDLGFLESALGDRMHILDGYHVIDALSLARRLFPGMGRYNLISVAAALDIDSREKHRAMADVMMTWKVFQKELDLLTGSGINTTDQIAGVRKRTNAPVATVKDYKLKMIENAIRKQGKLDITYQSVWDNKVTKRVITPKKIAKGYDKCYIIAHCHMKNAERNFRLDSILEARPHV
jgi:DNA polymerase III epsilon subunit